MFTVPSEKAPAMPVATIYQKPTEACEASDAGAEAVAVTPEKPVIAFFGATFPAKSVPETEAGKEAVAPPVALSAYFVANTPRRLPKPAFVALDFCGARQI